jgi:hypothetical protein
MHGCEIRDFQGNCWSCFTRFRTMRGSKIAKIRKNIKWHICSDNYCCDSKAWWRFAIDASPMVLHWRIAYCLSATPLRACLGARLKNEGNEGVIPMVKGLCSVVGAFPSLKWKRLLMWVYSHDQTVAVKAKGWAGNTVSDLPPSSPAAFNSRTWTNKQLIASTNAWRVVELYLQSLTKSTR